MKYPLVLLLLSSTSAFVGDGKYTFFLIDSTFAVVQKSSFNLRSFGEPTKDEVGRLANSLSMYPTIPLDSKPHGESWFAYQAPTDPGEAFFISNSSPPIPLLKLGMDGMCGCVTGFQAFGVVDKNVKIPGARSKLIAERLENDFGFGSPLLDAEVSRIFDEIDDYSFHVDSGKPITIELLKLENGGFYRGNAVSYIAFFLDHKSGGAPIAHTRGYRIFPLRASDRVDFLGRKVEGMDSKIIRRAIPTLWIR